MGLLLYLIIIDLTTVSLPLIHLVPAEIELPVGTSDTLTSVVPCSVIKRIESF